MKYTLRPRFEESQPDPMCHQWGVYAPAGGSNLGYCVFSSTNYLVAEAYCNFLNGV